MRELVFLTAAAAAFFKISKWFGLEESFLTDKSAGVDVQ
jgi:hypothetical protein